MSRKRIYFAADGRLLSSLAAPLERTGLSVVTFDSQAALVSRVSNDPPDALLVRARLSDGTALDAFTALPADCRPPTIVILSQTQGSLRPTLLEAGIHDVAISPIRPRQLADQLVQAAGGFKRGDRRVAVSLVVAVGFEGRTIHGVTVDVSRSGVGLSLREALPANAVIAVRLMDQTRTLEVYGRVLHTQGSAHRRKIGVRLIGLSDAEETALMRMARREEIPPAPRIAPTPMAARPMTGHPSTTRTPAPVGVATCEPSMRSPLARPLAPQSPASRMRKVSGNGRFLDGSFDLPSIAPPSPPAAVAARRPRFPRAASAPPSPPFAVAAQPTAPGRPHDAVSRVRNNGAVGGGSDACDAALQRVRVRPLVGEIAPTVPTLPSESRSRPRTSVPGEPASPPPLEWHDVDLDDPATPVPRPARASFDSRPNWPKGSSVRALDSAPGRTPVQVVPVVAGAASGSTAQPEDTGIVEEPASPPHFTSTSVSAPDCAPEAALDHQPDRPFRFAAELLADGCSWDVRRSGTLEPELNAQSAPTAPPPSESDANERKPVEAPLPELPEESVGHHSADERPATAASGMLDSPQPDIVSGVLTDGMPDARRGESVASEVRAMIPADPAVAVLRYESSSEAGVPADEASRDAEQKRAEPTHPTQSAPIVLADTILELALENAPAEDAAVGSQPAARAAIENPVVVSAPEESIPRENLRSEYGRIESRPDVNPTVASAPLEGVEEESAKVHGPPTESAPTESTPAEKSDDAPRRLELPASLPTFAEALEALKSSRTVLIEWFPDLGLAARQQAPALADLLKDRSALQTAALCHLANTSEVEWLALAPDSAGTPTGAGTPADHLQAGVVLRFLRAGPAMPAQADAAESPTAGSGFGSIASSSSA